MKDIDPGYTSGDQNSEFRTHGEAKLNVPYINFHSLIARRLKEISSGDLLTPRAYSIVGEVISCSELKKEMRDDYLIHRHRLGEIPQNIAGYHLKVNSYNRLFTDQERTTPHLNMVIIGDTASRFMHLYQGSFSCRVQLGGKHYDLDYIETSNPTVAVLESVTPLHHYKASLYDSETPLSDKKIEKLELDKKGFPKKVDWRKTLLMYVSQATIDANGEKPLLSVPLTAEHIHSQTLIPANNYFSVVKVK